ncbi:MAG TPA: tyrosine-type recombinase/integrase [Candidatus Acidoferrales bacterium]|nr:tyrosine-type recombinase/integrase [Candidatus Acidoferrales bacterium]
MRSYARFNRGLARQYDQWMVAMHYAKATQHTYRKTIRRFIEFLGKRSLATVSHVDIRQFIACTSADGASLGVVYRDLGVLRLFYDFLNLGGLVSYVAPRFVRLRRPWWNSLAPLNESQVQRLIAATRTLRERALVELFYATGCRLSEAIHLKVEDLDLDARTARILGKLGKARIVLLTKNAAEALRGYIGDRRGGFVFRQERPVPMGCLTTQNGKWLALWHDYGGQKPRRRRKYLGSVEQLPYGTARRMHQELLNSCNLIRPHRNCPLSKMAVQTVIKKVANRAGLKKVTPHTLRRTFATHLHDHGASVEVIQALMGHVWIQTTMKYARISTDRLANTFERCHPRGKLNGQASQ